MLPPVVYLHPDQTVVLHQEVRLARHRHDVRLRLGQVLAHDQLEPVQTRDAVARRHLYTQGNDSLAILLDRVFVRVPAMTLHPYVVDRAVV